MLRLTLLATALVAAAVVSSGCGDFFVDYTVFNETSQDLLTWAMFPSCAATGTDKQDYLQTEVVRSHDSYHYVGRIGANVQCVQVATTDRRLVLSEPHRLGASFTVSDPLKPYGDPVPERNALPSKTRLDEFRDASNYAKALDIFFAVAIIGAAVAAARALIGRVRRLTSR